MSDILSVLSTLPFSHLVKHLKLSRCRLIVLDRNICTSFLLIISMQCHCQRPSAIASNTTPASMENKNRGRRFSPVRTVSASGGIECLTQISIGYENRSSCSLNGGVRARTVIAQHASRGCYECNPPGSCRLSARCAYYIS